MQSNDEIAAAVAVKLAGFYVGQRVRYTPSDIGNYAPAELNGTVQVIGEHFADVLFDDGWVATCILLKLTPL